jgi:hypothetical protein
VNVETTKVASAGTRSFGYWWRLVSGSFRTMLDVGMLALGVALLGLAVALILDAFDIATVGVEGTTTSLLGAALVIGIVGAFAMGIASEGGWGAAQRLRSLPVVETLVGRIAASVVIGLVLLLISAKTTGLTSGLALPLRAGHEMLAAAGKAGVFAVPIVGVPLAHLTKQAMASTGRGEELELPVLFVIWAVAELAFFSMPLP